MTKKLLSILLAVLMVLTFVTPAMAVTKPKKLTSQSFPDVTPMKGGKIKFPAPKNMEKRAKPIIKISLFFFIFTPLINLYI